MDLRKYWIKVGDEYSLSNCYGITAWTEDDAINILKGITNINITNSIIQEINSLDELDQHHVFPNIGDPLSRGIWFPTGLK